ncbi:MAG: apolipoprotein A1/A4/E family protein [Planctomycetes bacterium]|nr:apolipoprotein A1/A4/E family protein [Planctomycetota bacterium]
MNQENTNQEVLQEVQALADDIAGESSALNASTSRHWKVVAWTYGIICVVVASYLGFIYAKFDEFLKPDRLAEMATTKAKEALPGLQERAITTLKGLAKGTVASIDVKALSAQLDGLSEQVVEKVQNEGPRYIERAVQNRQKPIDESVVALRQKLAKKLEKSLPDMVDRMMESREQVESRISGLREQLTQQINDSIPQMLDVVLARGGDLEPKIRDIREKLATEIKDKVIPRLMDSLSAEQLKEQVPKLREELLAQLQARIPEALDQLEPRLRELERQLPEQRKEYAKKLLERAPEFRERLRPRLIELRDESLPDVTERLSATLQEQAPQIADTFRDQVIEQVLPQAKKLVMQRTMERVSGSMPELKGVVDKAVTQIVQQHMDDIKSLDRDDLTTALEAAFEEAAGPVLDDFSKGAEQGIKDVKQTLTKLLTKKELGQPLTEDEQLYLRYVQLWKTYWNVRMAEKSQ